MRRLLTACLLAGALAAPAPALAPSASAAERDRTDTSARPAPVRLDGVTVRLFKRTRQVVTVNHTGGSNARVTFWSKSNGKWRERFQTGNGRIGYGGLVKSNRRVQGSGKTPLGSFRLPWAFGMHAQRAGWDPSYRKVRDGDYWVLDNQSSHYNKYRNKARGGFRWRLPPSDPNGSERLKSFPQQYEWAFVTSFNDGQVRHRGGAIFLHVNGSGATAGCVSAPRKFIRKLMFRIRQDNVPVIGIGR